MPCYTPLKAYRSETEVTSTGKQAITFKENGSHTTLNLPCGQCIGCRLERSRQWAIRCMHEAQLHEKNIFITLTINEDQPIERRTTLIKKDFQDFMKRLRAKYPKDKYGHIGYYYCGEYGEKYSRPHYHACIFGFDFPDKTLWRTSRGNSLYTSEILNSLWKHGYCIIGDVTFESAAYVARYITKKITGANADEYYSGRLPEYTNMSKKPAIGLEWIKKYHQDVYPSDEVILKGKKIRPARYYDKYYEKEFEKEFQEIKVSREEKAHIYELSPENTQERRLTKYLSQLLKNKKLKRAYESSMHENVHHKQNYDLKVINFIKGQLNERT